MFVDIETQKIVNEMFGFAATGEEQDWAFELSDEERVAEFIETMQKGNFSYKVRYAIIELILSSYDDYLNFYEDENLAIWKNILELISKDKDGYNDIIDYWALREETNNNNLFNITPLIREIEKHT